MHAASPIDGTFVLLLRLRYLKFRVFAPITRLANDKDCD